ncbi:MAG: FtsX-like permease family protein, partial [Sarcina sp.]
LSIFDSNYINRYKKSFPLEAGISVFTFKDYIDDKVFKVLDTNYKNSFMMSQKNLVSKESIKIKDSLERDFLKDGLEIYSDYYNVVNMNYKYINYLAPNIDKTEWTIRKNDCIVPVVLGKNFKKLYSVGDLIKGIDKQYKVIHILENELLFSVSGQELSSDSESLNDTIITPLCDLNKEESFLLIIAENSLDKSKEIFEQLHNLDSDLIGKGVNDELVGLLKMINSKKITNIFQTVATTLLAMFIVILTIKYKINDNKEKIGIIMTYGGDSKYIANKIFKEATFLVLISTIISIPITFKLTKLSFLFFYNTRPIVTVVISFFVALLILSITIKLSLLCLKKLTLKDLLGGVRE